MKETYVDCEEILSVKREFEKNLETPEVEVDTALEDESTSLVRTKSMRC